MHVLQLTKASCTHILNVHLPCSDLSRSRRLQREREGGREAGGEEREREREREEREREKRASERERCYYEASRHEFCGK